MNLVLYSHCLQTLQNYYQLFTFKPVADAYNFKLPAQHRSNHLVVQGRRSLAKFVRTRDIEIGVQRGASLLLMEL